MSARRPGRTQQIAYDDTPFNSPNPDLDARIGWLLVMSRLHHRDAEFQDGRRFAEALADSGYPVSRSLLSRWESGEIPISYEGMSACERALGLEAGQISSITGYIKATIQGLKTRVVQPRLDPASREFADRLDELVDAAEDGTALARDWQELGWHLAAAPLVHLRKNAWETVVGRLVNQVPRTVKLAYRQYSIAAMNLASLPRAQDYMVDAIAAYMAAPGVQVVTTPLGLLDRLPTTEAARLVLEIMDRPQNQLTYVTGVWLATQKVLRGQFSPAERAELDMLVLKLWRQNPARASQELAELIAGMPEGMRSTLVHAATKAGRTKLGYVVEHREELVANKARAFSREIAEAARTRVQQEPPYGEDRMLARLIREGLFQVESERRHLAALLITSSPFGPAVADELLVRLGDPGFPEWMRARFSTLVRYLSDDSHRMRMLPFVDDPSDEVAFPAAQAVGHLTLNAMSDQALRNSLGKEWSMRGRSKMYALGMSGSPGLDAITRSTTAPQWQQEAARWWLEQGPAIRH